MWAPSDVWELNKGCVARGLPLETSKELLKWLVVGKAAGAKGLEMSPSHAIDILLHWVLLNSVVRKQLELSIGEIHHSTATADLPEEEKAKRRNTLPVVGHVNVLQAPCCFECCHIDGDLDAIFRCKEPGTIFTNVREIRLKAEVAEGMEILDREVVKYCLNTVGWREVFVLILSKKFTCSPEDRAYLESCRKSLPQRARDEAAKTDERVAKQSLKRPRDDEKCYVTVLDVMAEPRRQIKFLMCKQRGTLRQLQEGVQVQWGINIEDIRLFDRDLRLSEICFRNLLLELGPDETLHLDYFTAQIGC